MQSWFLIYWLLCDSLSLRLGQKFYLRSCMQCSVKTSTATRALARCFAKNYLKSEVSADLNSACLALTSAACSENQQADLETGLRGLMPWRKGPFQFLIPILIPSGAPDWKWDRVAPHIQPLENRLVLDVAAARGYHMWRMLGAGAKRDWRGSITVVLMQFQAYKKYAMAAGMAAPIDLLPLKMEDVPAKLKAFDTVFSMGVLYHRKSPLEHLQELKTPCARAANWCWKLSWWRAMCIAC